MKYLLTFALIIVGIIHLLPLSGFLGVGQLAKLYGFEISDPNLAILMRHRAILFGLLGLYLVASAFRKEWQLSALLAGFASVLSFIWLAWTIGDYNEEIGHVVLVDIVAFVLLIAGLGAYLRLRFKFDKS